MPGQEPTRLGGLPGWRNVPAQRKAGSRLQGSEHCEQHALLVWAAHSHQQYPDLRWLFAIPNQGAGRNKRLQQEGVKPGVPDLCLPVPRAPYHGLFIELKVRGGRLSDAQAEWITMLHAHGYRAVVCVGWPAARDVIETYLAAAAPAMPAPLASRRKV